MATNDHHATSKKYVDDAISTGTTSFGDISAGIITATDILVDDVTADNLIFTAGPTWTSGSGSPEGSVTASVGSLYTNTSGGSNTTLWVKESGTGNTGWVSK